MSGGARLVVALALALVLALAPANAPVFAAEVGDGSVAADDPGARNIYIGDIVSLEISSSGTSVEELRALFEEFEILGIEENQDVYVLSVRTFTPGQYTILLADKEIVIEVGSTLDDILRDDIFEGDGGVAGSGPLIPWRILLCVAAGLFAFTGVFLLLKNIRKGRAERLSPYQLFLRRCGAISQDDGNYFVDLTFYFKEFVGALYRRRIIGKTTDEIIGELRAIEALDPMLAAIWEWLRECDRLKFTGVAASWIEKDDLYRGLLDLASGIDGMDKGDGAA